MRGEHGAAEPSSIGRETVPRNRLRLSLVAAIAAFGLAACTGDPAPVGTPSNGSPVTSASAAVTPQPTRPVEAATPTSAIQFTRYFIALYNHAYRTYDTTAFTAIAQPSCEYCKSTAQDIKALSDQDVKLNGYEVTLIEVTSPPIKIEKGTIVIAVISQSPGQRTAEDGTQTLLEGVKNLHVTFGLDWTQDGWSVRGVDIDEDTGTPWRD